MKMKKLVVLPIMMLLLTACNGNDSGGGGGGGGSGDYKPLTINFYLDYNHYDEENPYLSARWYYDKTFTKEDIGLTDPTEVPDPYYPTFKGWSKYALVDEDSYLWNFGVDKISESEAVNGVFEIFGIYVGD